MSDTPTNPSASEGARPGGTPRQDGPYVADDEISLVDLLVVLIRRRRLVIGLPLLVGALVAGVLYLGPMVGAGATPVAQYEATLTIEVPPLPAELDSIVGFNLLTTAHELLSDLRIVAAAYREAFPGRHETADTAEFHSFLSREVVGSALQGRMDRVGGLLTVTYRDTSADGAAAFVDALVAEMYRDLDQRLSRRVSGAISVREQALSASAEELRSTIQAAIEGSSAPGGALDAAQATVQAALEATSGGMRTFSAKAYELEALRVFLVNESYPFVPLGEAVASRASAGASRAVKLVVSVFAAFFLAVFLAFVLEYIRRLRSDPGESAKIRAAWNRE